MYWYYIIAFIIIVIDQLSKWVIVKTMAFGDQKMIIENFFYITSHRNQGAAWGILQGQMLLFYIITAVVVIGIIFYMQKYAKENKVMAVSLSMILGGALGNFIDRLFRQEVVDFFDFTIFNYNYPIFNVADSSLVVGVILIIIATIIDEKKKGKVKQ
jgi:signal peptidase II